MAVPGTPAVSAAWLNDGVTRLTVDWANFASITRYQINRWDNISGWVTVYDKSASDGGIWITDPQTIDFGTTSNRLYVYTVRARNSDGWSAWGNSNYVQTTPAAPGWCAAATAGPKAIQVSWGNNATQAGGYSFVNHIQYTPDGTNWYTVATVGGDQNTYTHTGLTAGSNYAYRVIAQSAQYASTYSAASPNSSWVTALDLPAAPSGVAATYNSPTQATITWTNNPTAGAPYGSLVVQRWNNVDNTWSNVGTISNTATSVIDSSLIDNRRYQWRVRAENAAGPSGWTSSGFIQTKPAAPTDLTISRGSGGSFIITWVNAASYTDYTTKVRYYKDGVLQTDTISVAGGVTTWTLSSVTLTSTYKFGVKAVSTTSTTTESAWVDTATVSASTIPNAPTGLTPNGGPVDLKRATTISWTYSSADASSQSAYEVNYRVVGSGTWTSTGKITSTTRSHTIAANTLTNGQNYEWQVRTYGVHATASAYSAIATFSGSTTPTVTMNSPASTTLTSSNLTVAWTYFDQESTPQASWEIELKDASGNSLEVRSGVGTTASVPMTTIIENGKAYVLTLRARDGAGLWSDLVTRNLTATFPPPAESVLTADYNTDFGGVVLTLTPSTPNPPTTVAATGASIQRRLKDENGQWGAWTTIAQNLAINATVVDQMAPIAGDGQYRSVTYSAIPSTYAAAPVDGPNEERWIFVSGGPNFTEVCRLWANVEISSNASRDRQLYHFAGRQKPVLFLGDATEQSVTVTGVLDEESTPPAVWEKFVKESSVVLLRDPLGRRIFGSIDQVSTGYVAPGLDSITFTIREVAYP